MRLVALVLGFLALVASAEECPFENGFVPCILSIKGHLASGAPYEFTLVESRFSTTSGEPEDDLSKWGIDGGYPMTYTKSMTLTIAGQEVQFRRKHFADITNVTGAEVLERGGTLVISIWGGDAAGSFEGEFVVRDNHIKERTMRAGEAPDAIWDRTEYHHP